MRQVAIILLLLAIATTASAAVELNCTSLVAPGHNFYEPTGACANDTVIKTCMTAYDTCVNAASTCASGFTCVIARLRCLENVVPGTECATWAAMLGNEKLYLAAGGDYNGSTLELSCQNVLCSFLRRKNLQCPATSYANVCVDAITGATPVPGSTPVSTVPPPGAIVVSFTISGDKAKFDALLATESGRKLAYAIITRILMTILGVTDSSKIVIIDIRTGSLVVDFYTTDPTLTLETVRSKMEAAKTANKADLFGELAAATGIPLSELGVQSVTVEVATAAPATPSPNGTTPAPLTDAASLATVAAALAAVLLALLL